MIMKRDPTLQRDPRVLRSLQYFETVARRGTVKDAASELGVSPSAVSHQLRALRHYVGEEILVKSGRGLHLTEAGSRLFERVTALLERIDQALEETIGHNRPMVRLAVCSSFGPAWLARRLPDFFRREPSIDVELRMYTQDPMQTDTVADAIVTADSVSEGFESVMLFDERLVAVGSPQMPRGADGMPVSLITTDILRHELAEDWRDFSAMKGVDYVGAASGGLVRCSHYLLALSMAEAGAGAALVPDFLAADPCRKGDLRLLDTAKLPSGRAYRLCYKISRSREPALKSLSRWMKTQCDRSENTPPAPVRVKRTAHPFVLELDPSAKAAL